MKIVRGGRDMPAVSWWMMFQTTHLQEGNRLLRIDRTRNINFR
jgi:hypothetical protein